MLDNSRLRIAIQKSGRLSEDSRELLSRCGIKVNLHTQRLIALAENMPIDILRVRDDDIPGLIMDGVVDLGIIGENVLEEELLSRRAQGEDPRYFTLRRLDFGGWMNAGKARRRWTANVLPPPIRTCSSATSIRKASPLNPVC